jgi:Protein of unknown function (DUF1203)
MAMTNPGVAAMNTLRYVALDTPAVAALQAGGPDANGQVPERQISDGDGNPCRHCLGNIAADRPMLVLAFRPFPAPQPFAEQGPIFLHAESCTRYNGGGAMPAIFDGVPDVIVRGYGPDDRIVYGTGQVVRMEHVEARAHDLLVRDDVAYLHVRSARNNCYQCRIERG